MLGTGKYVSIDRVIERVYSNAGYSNIDWVQAIEHIGSAIRLIGLPQYYTTKITSGDTSDNMPIQISDYRGILPCDLVYIIQCREYTQKIPMVYATDNFHLNQRLVDSNTCVTLTGTDYTDYNNLTEEDLADDVKRSQFFNYQATHNYETILYQMEKYAVANINSNLTSILKYYVQGGIIFTNFETGYVEVSYKAYPTDSNNLPLIPDDEKFINALEKYLIERIDYKLWRQGQLSGEIYKVSKQERNWAIAQAKVGGRIPSIDEAETLKNVWLRLIPQVNDHADGFKTLANGEVRYNK